MIKNHILNLRPYSWIDLILLGFLAKFSISRTLNFDFSDFYFIGGLLLLWFFFNFSLEAKHNYSYRSKTSLYLPVITLLFAIVISVFQNLYSLIPLVSSVLLIFVYLQKNKNAFLGNFSSIARGLIESFYFLYAVLLLSSFINQSQIILSISIFLIYTSRALVGDIRDVKHNKEANKQTIPVTLGVGTTKLFIVIMLIASYLISALYFGNYFVVLSLILFSISLLFFSNGYVLHQLMIVTTLFFHVNLIAFFTNQNLILFNLIYFGILLNCIFYPLLQRKSNPTFVN